MNKPNTGLDWIFDKSTSASKEQIQSLRIFTAEWVQANFPESEHRQVLSETLEILGIKDDSLVSTDSGPRTHNIRRIKSFN